MTFASVKGLSFMLACNGMLYYLGMPYPKEGVPGLENPEGPSKSAKEKLPPEQGDRGIGHKEEFFFNSLKALLDKSLIEIAFEAELKEKRLLSGLEQLGILLSVPNPNPFDNIAEEAAHEQWWKEHPEMAQDFVRRMEERKDILKYLLVGYLLGSSYTLLSGFPWRKSPRDVSSQV